MRRHPARDDEHAIPPLAGAAVGAPLSQGREGSIPVEIAGTDLTLPVEENEHQVRGEPTEPTTHSPIAEQVERQPVPTGEPTVVEADAGTRRSR